MKALITSLLLVMGFSSSSLQAYEPAGTPPDWDPPMPPPKSYGMLLADRLETGFADEGDTYVWDAQAWYGNGRTRLWLKSEGEGQQGESPEDAELQILYSRLIAPFWDWQIGIRQDFEPSPNRTHFVVGLQGLVPYEFEWDSALFVSEEGDVSARIETEYDFNLTQRWILQPRLEVNGAFSSDREIGMGSGITSTELGLRLRYHFRREVAPYIGIGWKQLYGETKDIARSEGEPSSTTSLVFGIRFWF
ncbi:MAG: copper resistance protein B [Pseudomonadales bacterium]